MKPRFGKYRLIAKLATGGMARVFLAEQSGLDGFTKKVVIKRMRSGAALDKGLKDQFLTEAVVAGQLSHPNLVQVYDFSETEGERFIVMEYVDGPSLKKLMQLAHKRGLLLPIDHALAIASLVCEGLAYAHEKRHDRTGEAMRLVHRDITPDNILFTRSGSVKVADFGIVKAKGQLHETRPGDVKGKLQYIAPEQLLSEGIDARADLFSLGVVLCEMLTGVGPFARENDAAVMDAIVHDEVPPLNALRPEAPPGLDAIIRKATAKKAADRYASALELQDALDRVRQKLAPLFGPAQLRDLVESLDPAPQPTGDEETTTDAPALGLEPSEEGTQAEVEVPEGRAVTRDDIPASIDIPITGQQPVHMPPPSKRRSVVLPVLAAIVVSATITYFVVRELTPAVIVAAPEPPKPIEVVKVDAQDAAPPPAPVVLDSGSEVAETAEPDAPPDDVPLTPSPSPAGGEGAPLEGRARVTLQSTPEAEVFLDGKSIGRTPLALPVKFGAHKLRFEDVEAGLNKAVALTVPKEKEYSKAFVFHPARLFVMAPDGATIFVGKKKMGKVPSGNPVMLYEGSYSVRVVYAPTSLDITKRLELKPGDRFEPFVDE